MTTNSDQVARNIADNDRRRAEGNKLVNPPCRHLGGGRFETAVLDGEHGYHFESDRVGLAAVAARQPGLLFSVPW